jgi:hypothetical protein
VQFLHGNPSHREKANDPNIQMTGPEDKYDRGYNATGLLGVSEKLKTEDNWTGTADRMQSNCFFSKKVIKNKTTRLKKSYHRNDSGLIAKNFTIRDISRH